MLIRIKRNWEMPEREATPESVYADRRRLVQGLALGPPRRWRRRSTRRSCFIP